MSHFSIPKHIFTGKNALEEAGDYIKEYGSKALVVTGKHVVKSPMMQNLKKVLEENDISYVIFDGITGEPTDKMVEEGLEIYKENNCDFCIGIGGGSPLDSAKAIAAMAVNKGKIADYNGKMITGKIPAIIAIPTTSGTGSECTKFTVITDSDKDIKMLLKGEELIPKIAIINPDFSMDMPKSVTAATGLDALTHAIEAYTSLKAMPFTDTFAVSAIKRIMKYLPIAYNNGYDAKAREEMSIAALEAGICINNSSVTIVHGMSRPIGALFHVSHGVSNAMLLYECMKFAKDGAYDRLAQLGREIGAAMPDDEDEVAADKFLEQVSNLCQLCEIPTLKEYGVDEAEFFKVVEKMAKDAVASGSPANTRKPVYVEDCISLYRKVYI